MLHFLNRVISWSFYLLFFLVPIAFVGNTSELFEFNKMWITFGLTIIIATSWLCKIVIERQIKIRKTLLDIPLLLFLASQIISTFLSIDMHTSLWGYYSRFNGGLYSMLSYGLLYFAFVSNIKKSDIMKYLYVILASAVFVALWGLPSHFGYDPTCLLFRGTLDVSCWTAAFQPKVRIFSTLGQPDWLAAYLIYLLPLSAALGMIFWKMKRKMLSYAFLAMTLLFYADLLYTRARSGFVGFLVGFGVFFLLYVMYSWRSFARHSLIKAVKHNAFFLLTLLVVAIATFFIGAPLSQLDNFSLSGISKLITAQKTVTKALTQPPAQQAQVAIPVQEFGGTDSGKIRLFVWKGALDIFLHNPLFGTGVETFAYAYYQYRPAGHNLTSEWDYLYNKAHNEFLNYLSTTGIVGLTTYLVVLLVTFWILYKAIKHTHHMEDPTEKNAPLLSQPYAIRYLLLALLSGYISILVTNFFGFSVVIMNIFLFLTPAFTLFLTKDFSEDYTLVFPNRNKQITRVSEFSWILVSGLWLVAVYFLFVLLRFWQADISYAYGQNLDHANQYQAAYSYLHDAVMTRPSEPTFQDELSLNDAVLSTALFQQKDPTNGAKLRDEAIAVSTAITTQHPYVVTFWKSRVRVFYTLAQVDPKYTADALMAIEKASSLAPTDAKVWYNMGLLYDQTGNIDKAIATLETTVKLKPDYRDSYYALALFYRQKAVGQDATAKTVKDQTAEAKAVKTMHFILDNFGPNDDLKIKDTLASWGEK